MKNEKDDFWTHINQGLVGRRICLEDSSDHGSTIVAKIVEIRLTDGILTIGTNNVEITKYDGSTSKFDMLVCEGPISSITDPNITSDGRVVFYRWAGRDSIVIYPSTEKK